MPLYCPKRRLSFDTTPAPARTSLEGRHGAAISSSCAQAPAAQSSPPLSRTDLAAECAFIGAVDRVVGAVDVGVAVEAAARQEIGRGAPAGGALRAGKARHVAAVAGRLVALLAQVRRAHAQQVV